ncbi:ATP-binding cassette domain-containing protein [Candidatus Poribacteria bacterium]|nr:ATP-binding cassette domain-containing protein [Candidatus Poribacteria bacterium]
MNETIFRIENLTKYYDDKLSLDVPHLELETGKIYAVVGPNGAGKTTLLNVLAGLDKPTDGMVFFQGQMIDCKSNIITDIRRHITMVMQDPMLFHTTVEKNVAYGLRVRSMDKKARNEKVIEALKMVGLSGFEKRKAYQLSAGETRRVALARALVLNPKVLLLDEPTANIDRQNAEVIEKLIQKIKSEQQTVIVMTTHDLSQAYRLADKIISLLLGRVIESSPENIFSGKIEESNGFKQMSLSPSLKILIKTEKKGNVPKGEAVGERSEAVRPEQSEGTTARSHICIDPKDIHISNQPGESNSCNSFLGEITSITAEKELVRLKIDVGVEFIALLPKQDFHKMNLNIGKQTYITFKTSDVHVFGN